VCLAGRESCTSSSAERFGGLGAGPGTLCAARPGALGRCGTRPCTLLRSQIPRCARALGGRCPGLRRSRRGGPLRGVDGLRGGGSVSDHDQCAHPTDRSAGGHVDCLAPSARRSPQFLAAARLWPVQSPEARVLTRVVSLRGQLLGFGTMHLVDRLAQQLGNMELVRTPVWPAASRRARRRPWPGLMSARPT
jgi:hypothetical protein